MFSRQNNHITGYTLKDLRSIPYKTTPSRNELETTEPLSSRVKQYGREFDYSSPSGVGVKNSGATTSFPQYIFTTWRLMKHKGKEKRKAIPVISSGGIEAPIFRR
jgi:hypothetical protein